MNKEYIKVEDKAIVTDEFGNKKVVPYNDNLNELLVQENLIEQMEDKLLFLKDRLSQNMKIKSKQSLVFAILSFIICFIMPMTISKLLPFILNIPDVYFTNLDSSFTTILGTAVTIAFSPIGVLLCHMFYKEYKNYNKKKLGVNNAIKELGKSLEKEKEKLDELKNKQNTKEETIVETIAVKSCFTELDKRIYLYRDCGANGRDYYEYYMKYGKLPEKVESNYNDDEQQIVKEYLEKNGPVLTKKYKPRIK